MKFEFLSGKRALGRANSRDYTDWAESLLYENIESENVAILASMGFERDPDSEEIEAYFQKSLKDIGLFLPDKEEALKIFAKILCEQILSGDLEPENGLNTLKAFYSNSYREAIYIIWDDLNRDISSVNESGRSIFNSGLNSETKNEYIKAMAAQFIDLLKLTPPICNCFFCLSICTACGYVGENELDVIDRPWIPEKLYRLIYKRAKTQRPICANCKTPFPISMRDYEGRKQYLSKKC